MVRESEFLGLAQWREAHAAVLDRISTLERHDEEMRGAEQEHQRFRERLALLEKAGSNHVAEEKARRDRLWLLLIGVITGLVCPLVVTTVIAYFHLRSS